MSDTFARGKRARVLVPTKSDVLETGKETIQTSIESNKRPWNKAKIVGVAKISIFSSVEESLKDMKILTLWDLYRLQKSLKPSVILQFCNGVFHFITIHSPLRSDN